MSLFHPSAYLSRAISCSNTQEALVKHDDRRINGCLGMRACGPRCSQRPSCECYEGCSSGGWPGKLLVAHHRQARPKPRMNIHKNARLTPQEPALAKAGVDSCWSSALQRQPGVSCRRRRPRGSRCGRAIVGWRVIAPRRRQVWVTAARRRTAASTVLLATASARSSGCGGSG
jgi:hypothetical protein